jgi:hypothetical protein
LALLIKSKALMRMRTRLERGQIIVVEFFIGLGLALEEARAAFAPS